MASDNVFKMRDAVLPSDQKHAKALTLSELALLCDQLIAHGADPDREVLVFSDPEGNSLVTIDAWAGVSDLSLHGMSVRVGDPDTPPLGLDKVERDAWLRANLPGKHVLIGALDNLFWEE